MRSIRPKRLQIALLGLGALALSAGAGMIAQAADRSSQSAALGNAATSDSAAAQLLTRPETFVLEVNGAESALTTLDKAALSGVIAAIQDARPLLVSVTEIGTMPGGSLERASAVRDWLLAHGGEGTEITVAGRDQVGGTASDVTTHDGQVRITLVE